MRSLSLLTIATMGAAPKIASAAEPGRWIGDATATNGDVLKAVADSAGGWHYEWDGQDEQDPTRLIGDTVWLYDGQETYYTGYQADSSLVYWNTADVAADNWDAVAKMFQTVRVDDHGGRWIVEDYTEDLLEDAMLRYEERVKADLGMPLDGDPFERYRELLEEDPREEGVDVVGELMWAMTVSTDCERMWYGADENTLLNNPMNAAANQRYVLIGIETGSSYGGGDWADYACSGILVSDTYVLTAAHCLTIGTYLNGSYRPHTNFRVCSYGNVQTPADCSTVASTVTQSGWLLWHGAADDYAMLELDHELNGGDLGYASISSALNATIEGFDSVITGYPGEVPSGSDHCVDNQEYSPIHGDPTQNDGMNVAINPVWDSTSVLDMTATLHKSANDLGHGWSGAGFRYNPADDLWYITGLESQSQYVGIAPSVEGAHIGPNHDQFRSWVLANI